MTNLALLELLKLDGAVGANVAVVDGDVLVAVRPALLVVEPDRVHHLVDRCSLQLITAVAQRDRLALEPISTPEAFFSTASRTPTIDWGPIGPESA